MRPALSKTRGVLAFKGVGSTLSSFARRRRSHWSNGCDGSTRKRRMESGRLIKRKEKWDQGWKVRRNKEIMRSKDTKISWRRQYVGRRASCQRFNSKRKELLAVINVNYRERKSRWKKFLSYNSTVTSHVKKTSYKKGEGQDIWRRIKTKGSYRNSTTHAWAAGNPRARGAKCWGSKSNTA